MPRRRYFTPEPRGPEVDNRPLVPPVECEVCGFRLYVLDNIVSRAEVMPDGAVFKTGFAHAGCAVKVPKKPQARANS